MRTPATWDNDIDGATWGEVTCHQFQQSQQPLLRQRCQRCVHVVFLLSLIRLLRHFFFSLSLSAAIMFASMAGFHWLAMTFCFLWESRWPFFVVLSFAPCGHWRLLSLRKRPGRVLTLGRKEGGWKKKKNLPRTTSHADGASPLCCVYWSQAAYGEAGTMQAAAHWRQWLWTLRSNSLCAFLLSFNLRWCWREEGLIVGGKKGRKKFIKREVIGCCAKTRTTGQSKLQQLVKYD